MLIRDIAHGEVVTEPGAYRIPIRWYHSQGVCPGPSISSSGLRTIVNQSPWHFWSTWEGNPDRYEDDEESDALTLGRAAHALLLGDAEFNQEFVYVPADAPNRPTATQVKAFERDGIWSDKAKPGAEFWQAFDAEAAGRTLLPAAMVETIMHMRRNLERSPEALAALTGGMTEVSMIWQDDATGVFIKSRPDTIPDNSCDFGDLKTFAPRTKSIERAVHQAITDNGYVMQMALACMGAEHVLGLVADDCVLVMAQSTRPFTVTPVRLDAEALHWGKVLCRHGIDRFAECLKTGHWPMPVEGVMTYSMPPSLLHRLGELQSSGQLPMQEAA